MVREAAKAAGLWSKCPYLEEVSQRQLQVYYDHVSLVIFNFTGKVKINSFQRFPHCVQT